MMCQSCHQNVATVHLTEIVQQSKKETHLCEACAKSKGVTYAAQFSVKDYLSGLGKGGAGKPAQQASGSSASGSEGFGACPSCGITFAEFRQSGRLGCAQDYEHFRRGLVPLLEKIHGARSHTGRIPQQIGARLERDRQLARLHKELQDAVADEKYERAAELRDRIRELEQQVEEQTR